MLLRAFFTTADILSLTAFVVSHFRIHDRGIDEGLNHEQSVVGRLLHDSSGLQYPWLLASLQAPLRDVP
jgi:hypothetical protein